MSGEAQYLVLEPSVNEGMIEWACYGQNADQRYLPANCR
ncbi:pilin [Marinobacter santoriniensis]